MKRPAKLCAAVAAAMIGAALVAVTAAPATAATTAGATLPFTSYEAEAGTLGGAQHGLADLGADHAVLERDAGGVGPRVRAADRRRPDCAVDQQHRRADQLHQRARLASRTPPAGGGQTATLDLYVNGTFRQTLTLNSQPELAVRGQQPLQRERPEPRRRQPARLLRRVPHVHHRRADRAGQHVQRCRGTRPTRRQFYDVDVDRLSRRRPRRPPSRRTRSRSPAAARSPTTRRPTARPTRARPTARSPSRTASTRRSRRARSCGSRRARST